MADTPSTAVLSDAEWAALVSEKMSLSEPDDLARVQKVLTEAGVTSGRPLSDQHSMSVESVYFAGIKVLRDDNKGATAAAEASELVEGTADHADDEADDPVESVTAHPTSSEPFAFQHIFDKPFTVFATEGRNSTGKSAILGVILWGLRGSPPSPTLQGDIAEKWLREVVVVYKVDSTRIVVAWRVFAGVPRGAVYAALGDSPVDLSELQAQGLQAAVDEHQTAANQAQAEADDDADADADAANGSAGPPSVAEAPTSEDVTVGEENEEPWPGEAFCSQLVEEGALSLLASFSTKDQFVEATATAFMDRLELERLPVWQKRPGAVDEHDADEEAHGWNSIAQALVIIDPTSRSVLGEHVMVTNLLLSLFLGSRWAIPTMVARTQKGRADQTVAGKRRRREADEKARTASAGRLTAELAAAQASLAALGDVPNYLDVLAATEQAKADSIAEARAHAAHHASLIAYGNAERDLESAQLNLHALAEAAATRRFWHSLTPSCCPRCDATIDAQMWAREQEGQCSLCATDFIDAPGVNDETSAPGDATSDADAASGDPEDSESEIVALREQVERQTRIVEDTSAAEDDMRARYERLRDAAAASAAAVDALDQAASTRRHELELAIVRLEARIDERAAIDTAATLPEDEEDEFVADVLKAALAYATKQRDADQKRALAQVSEIITELGIEFGVRNLVSAKLGGNGHLPVIKGETKKNFSEVAPGERLRLRIALIVGLLRAGRSTGTSRHPGLLIIDDLTSHEISHEDATTMAQSLAAIPGLQTITASTYADTLTAAVGDNGTVVGPESGGDVMF